MKAEGSFQERGQSGWENETQKHEDFLKEFLKNHAQSSEEKRPRYDYISDLHTSGDNLDVLRKIQSGDARAIEISVLYENGKPTQVHAVFKSEGKGQNIDVYLMKKALQDYLKTLES